jgi:hypothetical protein
MVIAPVALPSPLSVLTYQRRPAPGTPMLQLVAGPLGPRWR